MKQNEEKYTDIENLLNSVSDGLILSAINNTYGASYDPAKMLQFMQAFEVFMKNGITAYPTTGRKLINLFNEAKIK